MGTRTEETEDSLHESINVTFAETLESKRVGREVGRDRDLVGLLGDPSTLGLNRLRRALFGFGSSSFKPTLPVSDRSSARLLESHFALPSSSFVSDDFFPVELVLVSLPFT